MGYTLANKEGRGENTDEMSVKIRTRGVDLYYGDRQVLKNITFDMGENKVTAFIGPVSYTHLRPDRERLSLYQRFRNQDLHG